ncbi:hypothetical protein pb186bvf_012257 [Paramecium bursaria]
MTERIHKYETSKGTKMKSKQRRSDLFIQGKKLFLWLWFAIRTYKLVIQNSSLGIIRFIVIRGRLPSLAIVNIERIQRKDVIKLT